MKNDVAQDAENLAEKIFNSLDPDDKFAIVNIASNENGNDIVLDNYSSIHKTFGYIHDKTPGLLERHGVIEGKTVGWWYVDVAWIKGHWGNTRPDDLGMDDNITDIAQKKGYISKDEIIKYYYVPTDDIVPRTHGQMAILVNKQKLEEFKSWCNSLSPIFNDEINCLEFLGEKILFEGILEKKCVKLLIKHINSTVSYKDFYEVRDEDYKVEVAQYGKTDSDEPSRVMFKRIRAKIYENKNLKEALILKESGGFGMFVKKLS